MSGQNGRAAGWRRIGALLVALLVLFAVLSFEITRIIDIDFSFVWDRNESPEREASGNTPERDDFRTTIGVGIEF